MFNYNHTADDPMDAIGLTQEETVCCDRLIADLLAMTQHSPSRFVQTMETAIKADEDGPLLRNLLSIFYMKMFDKSS